MGKVLLVTTPALAVIVMMVWALRVKTPDDGARPDSGLTRSTAGVAGRSGADGDRVKVFSEVIGNSRDFRREYLAPGADGAPVEVGDHEDVENGLFLIVLGADGDPLAGAVIDRYRPPRGFALTHLITDDSGRAPLSDPRPGDRLEVRARGYLKFRVALGPRPWAEPYLLHLEDGAFRLVGCVGDDLGHPVAGAKVTLRGTRRETPTSVVSDRTGDGGDFLLALPRAVAEEGRARFAIEHPDYCFLGHDLAVVFDSEDLIPEGHDSTPFSTGTPFPDAAKEGIPGHSAPDDEAREDETPRGLAFKVHRWARILVEITDPQGEILPDARIRVLGPPGTTGRDRMPPGTGPVRDPCEIEGHLLLVPPWLPLWMRVEHPNYRSIEREVGSLSPAETRRMFLRLEKPVTPPVIRFQVLNTEGVPIPEADVTRIRELVDPEEIDLKRIPVDERGGFEVRPEPEGLHLRVEAPEYAPRNLFFSPPWPEADPTIITLAPSRIGISVRVLCREEIRASGVVIELADEDPRGGLGKAACIDETGWAHFTGLDPDVSYRVTLGAGQPGVFLPEGYDWVPSPAAFHGVRAGSVVLTFKLAPPASLTGRLGEGRRATMADDVVFLTLSGGPAAPEAVCFTVSALVGKDGSFHFGGLPPGSYRMWTEDGSDDGFARAFHVLTLTAGQAGRFVEED